MATYIGIGFSQKTDAHDAAKESAFEAKTNLGADRIDLSLVFTTVDYSPTVTLPVFQKVLGTNKLIGCSTAGLILSNAVATSGIAVLTIHSDEMRFGIGSVSGLGERNVYAAGVNLAQGMFHDFGEHGRNACLLFVDGQYENNSLLLKGVQQVLGDVFPIVGGGSCDNFRFNNIFQIFQDQVVTRSAIGLMLGGHMQVSASGQHGWKPLGKPRIITKTEGHIIRTIDHKKASSIYEEYFGDDALMLHSTRFGQMSILYPLGIAIKGTDQYLLRNAVDILDDGSIVCQGDVPENSPAHIMIGNKESCQEAARRAAEEARKNFVRGDPKLILVIESMARLKLLGRSTTLEVQEIKKVFGPKVPIFGMYSYGEICPFESVERIRKPYLQNESIVVLAIG